MSAGVYASAGETSGKAIASLVLGIGGFVIFPVVLSILAIVFGRSAEARDRASVPGWAGPAWPPPASCWAGSGWRWSCSPCCS